MRTQGRQQLETGHAGVVPGEQMQPGGFGFGRGWFWVAEGFRYFRQAPMVWMLITVIFVGVSIVLSLVPLVFLLTFPLSVLFMGGMMLGCAAIDRHEPLRLSFLVAGFKVQTGALMGLGGLYLAASVLVMLLLAGIVASFVTPQVEVMTGMASGVMTPQQLQSLLIVALAVNLVAVLLMSPVIMAVWFAPALIVLQGVDAIGAARLSLRACLRNWRPFLVYGFVMMALMLLALLPFGLGLLVFIPVFAASVYVGWKDIFQS